MNIIVLGKYIALLCCLVLLGAQALFYFTAVAFSIPGNGGTEAVAWVIGVFLFLLPLACLASAGLMIWQFFTESTWWFLWTLAPILAFAFFVLIFFGLL